MGRYLASRTILISTAYNEPNIIMERSLRHNETIRVRLSGSSSLQLELLLLKISLQAKTLPSLFILVVYNIQTRNL